MKRILVLWAVLTMFKCITLASPSAVMAQTCVLKWWGDWAGWVTTSETSKTAQACQEAFQALLNRAPECSGPCYVPGPCSVGECGETFLPEGCYGWGEYTNFLGNISCENETVCDTGGWSKYYYGMSRPWFEETYDYAGSWDVFCGVDTDSDGLPDTADNCSYTINPNQEDTLPPPGNGRGDACDCEGDFNCDADVDGSDASTFKVDFGRSTVIHPCIAGDTCKGDFNCDGDVDGTDASLFKSDFGRSSMQSPCPACVQGDWCGYGEPYINAYWDSGCQGSFMEFLGGTCGDDEIVAEVAGNVIHLTHSNAFYNCCPDDIPVTVTSVEGHVLRLWETESNVGCRCMCCYTVESEITVEEPGEYTIEYCWRASGSPCETLTVTVPD
jgi:hypothetical protein